SQFRYRKTFRGFGAETTCNREHNSSRTHSWKWNSLSPTNHGRYVLAVLALNAEPMGFSDITALTRYEESRVRDALADVREMFLIVNEIGEEATYQLGEMTRSFVLEQSKRLEQYAAIKERVAKYR